MESKILKLCRRLKRCTLEDIVQFTELDSEEVQTVLYYLLDSNKIIENNGVYSIVPDCSCPHSRNKKDFNLMIPHHALEDVEIVIKGFCLEIPPQKIALLIKCGKDCVCNFYQIFRRKIYEKQHKKLLNYYFKKPQITRTGTFFEKYAYFYFYNNNVYVTERPLRANFEKFFTKAEICEYKKVYSFLKRVESHNINENYVYHRLAEAIWRRNKSFEELYSDMYNMLFT